MAFELKVRAVERRARQSGSSLLEVLIAILIMSFGLLALGGLTAAAQQYMKMSQFQSIGMQLATELGERMRGNVTGFELGMYDKKDAYSHSTAEVERPGCAASPCTPTERAAIDMADWTNELRMRLPGGDAFVQRDSANALATDIWIMWIDPDLSMGDTTLSVARADEDCPEGAASSAADAPAPRCMYYRISL